MLKDRTQAGGNMTNVISRYYAAFNAGDAFCIGSGIRSGT